MQTALNDSLTEYIRHYLMRDGSIIKQNDVYYALKEKVSPANAIDYLKELQKYSVYYQRLIDNCQYIVDGKSCHDIVDSRIVFIDS